MDEFEHVLERGFEYHSKGEVRNAELLILRAPSSKHQKYRVKLQQGFFRAINALKTSGAEQSQDQEMDIEGAEILALMLSSDVDMVEYHDDFKRLITAPGVCLVEGEEDLTLALYEKLSPDDLDLMMGAYLANFILSSALKTLSRK